MIFLSRIWLDIAFDWLTLSPNLLVLHYEDFKSDPIEGLNQIHNFIKYPTDPKRIKCRQQNPSTLFKRKWKPDYPDNLFPENIKVCFKKQ